MNQQNNSWQTASSGREYLEQHVESLRSYLSDMDLASLESMAELIDERVISGNNIFCIGNGGSAATAAHLSTDLFFGRRLSGEQRPKAVSLVSNVPLMTALSNDVGYDDVFVEQLNGLFQTGDMVIGISASGNSENVLRALDFAKNNGGTALGLVGFDGGGMKSRCDICVHIQTPGGEYELVEDVHHAICHMLAGYLKFKAISRRAESGSANE